MSFEDVEREMDAAVGRRVFPGAVLLVREGTRVFYHRAFGHRSVEPELTQMSEETIFDVAAQPAGGGTVVCEDGAAELLLGGDLPIPPVRLVADFFRARWTNVPPGKHAVRYPGGRVADVVVEDGGEVVLPK